MRVVSANSEEFFRLALLGWVVADSYFVGRELFHVMERVDDLSEDRIFTPTSSRYRLPDVDGS
jgi:hypothetical protein